MSFCAVTAYEPARVESTYSQELAFNVPCSAPVVSFSANPGSGAVPLNVAFTNTTSGQVSSWVWNFGDGMTSNLKSPTHAYGMPGSYKATLTASTTLTRRPIGRCAACRRHCARWLRCSRPYPALAIARVRPGARSRCRKTGVTMCRLRSL